MAVEVVNTGYDGAADFAELNLAVILNGFLTGACHGRHALVSSDTPMTDNGQFAGSGAALARTIGGQYRHSAAGALQRSHWRKAMAEDFAADFNASMRWLAPTPVLPLNARRWRGWRLIVDHCWRWLEGEYRKLSLRQRRLGLGWRPRPARHLGVDARLGDRPAGRRRRRRPMQGDGRQL